MFSQTPGLTQEWFMSNKDFQSELTQNFVCVISNLSAMKKFQNVWWSQVLFSQQIVTGMTQVNICVRRFLNKHCTFQKGLLRGQIRQKKRIGEKEVLTSGDVLEKGYEETSMYFFWRGVEESSKEWGLVFHLKNMKMPLKLQHFLLNHFFLLFFPHTCHFFKLQLSKASLEGILWWFFFLFKVALSSACPVWHPKTSLVLSI